MLDKERKHSSKLSSSWDNPYQVCMRPQGTENGKTEDRVHIAQRPVCLYRSDHLALVQSASLDTSRSYQNSSVKSMETKPCTMPRFSLRIEELQDYEREEISDGNKRK